ncbi:MAG: sigma-70 family RNA polymerase sigma factor [Armatimonadetes bacterium]|nr:sigma-70 family RNA polymerase sigma factor [Armatimonadota bacterium]
MPDSPRAAQFETLLAPILGSAYGVALRLTGNRDDAQDLVQDAALRAFAAFETFEPQTHFKAWFLRVLVNCHLNRARSASRRPQTVALDDGEDALLFEAARREGLMARGVDPADALLARFDADLVAVALSDLPNDFRVVATLFLLEEMSYEEIALIVECPVGTVRSRLHRGRKLLQKALWELARERGLVGKP